MFISSQIRLKNILIGTAIDLGILFLTFLVLYYIFVFLPNQETERMYKTMEESERLFWEYKNTHPTQP